MSDFLTLPRVFFNILRYREDFCLSSGAGRNYEFTGSNLDSFKELIIFLNLIGLCEWFLPL